MTEKAKRSNTPIVPARYFQRIIELLMQREVDVIAVLQQASLDPQKLADTDGLLSVAEIEALIESLLQTTGRSDLSLDMGRSIHLGSHSVVGYALLSSPTVEYALRLAARFFGLIFPTFQMRYRRTPEQAVVTYTPTLAMSHGCLNFLLETIATATHFDIRELLQHDLPPYDLHLSIVPPQHAHRFAELIGASCHFASLGKPGIRFEFPLSVVDSSPASADATLLAMAEGRCANLLSDVVATRNVAEWVRMMLREAGDGFPSQQELAHTLNISTRTLDRHMAREGVKFRALLNEERQRKACKLLADTALSVTSVAHELGYTDAANFTRAFRREQGCSPSDFRSLSSSA